MSDLLNVQVRDDEDIEVVENALEAAAREDGKCLNDHGKPRDDQVTRSEALVNLAEAYTGWQGGEE